MTPGDRWRAWKLKNPAKYQAILLRNRGRPPRGRKNKRDGLKMVIYVVKAGPFTKVGIAENIRTRMVVVRCHCPLPVELVYHSKPILRPRAREIEVACHNHLIDHHVQGEWFKVLPQIAINFINTMAEEADSVEHPQLKLVI